MFIHEPFFHEPSVELRCGFFPHELSKTGIIMKTGVLIGKDDIISMGYAHEEVSTCHGTKHGTDLLIVHIDWRMICEARGHAHGQSHEFSHEVIFEVCPVSK